MKPVRPYDLNVGIWQRKRPNETVEEFLRRVNREEELRLNIASDKRRGGNGRIAPVFEDNSE